MQYNIVVNIVKLACTKYYNIYKLGCDTILLATAKFFKIGMQKQCFKLLRILS